MQDSQNIQTPKIVAEILAKTEEIGFQMVSEPLVGSLLRTLAASKPAGRFLELGTGTGVSTAWLLDGMDARGALISIENEANLIAVAQTYLGRDRRLCLRTEDAGAFLEGLEEQSFDLIFADTWAGKYTHLAAALNVLKPGGIYIVDDMLPQSNWPENHDIKVAALITELENRRDLTIVKMSWGSGIILAAKI
jgi:predicted O-methyltransferase YrrM